MSDVRDPLPVETNPDPLTTALVKINVTDVVLSKLRKEAEAFPEPKTKEEFEAIRRHRLDMVPLRTTTVKVLKAMREDAVAFQKKVIAKEELEHYLTSHKTLSTHLVAGKTEIRVFGATQPDPSFQPVEADLEDVYFLNINHGAQNGAGH